MGIVHHAAGTRMLRVPGRAPKRGSLCGVEPYQEPLLVEPGDEVSCKRCLAILSRRVARIATSVTSR